MNSLSPTFITFYAFGFVHGYTAAAIVLLSIAALIIRRRRRALVSSINTLSWIVIVTGAVIGGAYLWEAVSVYWLSDNPYERATFAFRFSSWIFWLPVFGTNVAPQMFWFRRARRNAWLSLVISTAVIAPGNVERLIVYMTSQSSEYLPASWQR